MPVVGVNTAVHKKLVSDGRLVSGVKTGSVESFAYSKRVRFDLREFGEGPNSQGGAMAETNVSADTSHRSSDDEQLRRKSQSEASANDETIIPCRAKMQHTGNSPGRIHHFHHSEPRWPPRSYRADPAHLPKATAVGQKYL